MCCACRDRRDDDDDDDDDAVAVADDVFGVTSFRMRLAMTSASDLLLMALTGFPAPLVGDAFSWFSSLTRGPPLLMDDAMLLVVHVVNCRFWVR